MKHKITIDDVLNHETVDQIAYAGTAKGSKRLHRIVNGRTLSAKYKITFKIKGRESTVETGDPEYAVASYNAIDEEG